MEDMKGDMAGAACVVGLMHALAARKAKVNAIGVIGLVENMPDGAAQRPGDIVRSLSGQTIDRAAANGAAVEPLRALQMNFSGPASGVAGDRGGDLAGRREQRAALPVRSSSNDGRPHPRSASMRTGGRVTGTCNSKEH